MLAPSHHYLPNLYAISSIVYRSYFVSSKRCEVDRYAWNASLQVVASQSAKLKFIPDKEYNVHLAFNAAQKELDHYNDIPDLILSVISNETTGGCYGNVIATLELNNVTPAKRLWQESRWVMPERKQKPGTDLSYPKQSLTEKVSGVAENVIKLLVDDWTEAQYDMVAP